MCQILGYIITHHHPSNRHIWLRRLRLREHKFDQRSQRKKVIQSHKCDFKAWFLSTTPWDLILFSPSQNLNSVGKHFNTYSKPYKIGPLYSPATTSKTNHRCLPDPPPGPCPLACLPHPTLVSADLGKGPSLLPLGLLASSLKG